jgi:uncharacterized cupredoxin-like copper-binding protein
MKRTTMVITLLLTALLLIAACGGGASEPTPTPAPAAGSAQETLAQIDVLMHDIYFGEENNNIEKPPVWTVKAGEEVTVNSDNKGGLEHSWAVLKAGTEVPMPFTEANNDLLIATTGNLPANTTRTTTFTAPEAGEYIVICTVAGHYPVMQGRLVVE